MKQRNPSLQNQLPDSVKEVEEQPCKWGRVLLFCGFEWETHHLGGPIPLLGAVPEARLVMGEPLFLPFNSSPRAFECALAMKIHSSQPLWEI